MDLTNSRISIPELNYAKDSAEMSKVIFDLNFKIKNYFNIKKILFTSNKTKVNISNLKMNKNFETDNFKSVEIKTF